MRRAYPMQRDARRRHRRRRPAPAAARAVVVAEVAEVDRVERVRRAAAAAVLGVGGVRHPRQRERVVLDAEVERLRALPAEIGDQRIVGVQDQRAGAGAAAAPSARRSSRARRSGRAGRETGCRAGSRAGEAARRRRPATARRPRTAPARRRCPTRAGGREQRGCDPAGHVGAGVVVHERDTGTLEDAGGHRGGGGLAVGGRHEHAAARRRAPSAPIAPGSRRTRTLPGRLVAPPPRSRESAPTARASASLGASASGISRLRRAPSPRRSPPMGLRAP